MEPVISAGSPPPPTSLVTKDLVVGTGAEASASSTVLVQYLSLIHIFHRHTGPVDAFTLTGRWHYLEYDFFSVAGSYICLLYTSTPAGW